jgi:orotidine-5'-phosphate decarboxylase
VAPPAFETAAIAVEAGVDWLEAGTPLLLAEGLRAVEQLRRRFPDHPIVADLKTMDGGYLETEMMAKAGANLVVVMGRAHEATIRRVVDAGRHFGVKVKLNPMREMLEGPVRLLALAFLTSCHFEDARDRCSRLSEKLYEARQAGDREQLQMAFKTDASARIPPPGSIFATVRAAPITVSRSADRFDATGCSFSGTINTLRTTPDERRGRSVIGQRQGVDLDPIVL